MSTGGLPTVHHIPGEPPELPGAPLSWRAWLLLPLVLISLAGIAIPLWGVHVRERAWDTVPPKPRLKRAAYDDELLELLQRPHLTMSDIELIKGLHDICDEDRRTNPANTISGDLRRRVDALLGKYR